MSGSSARVAAGLHPTRRRIRDGSPALTRGGRVADRTLRERRRARRGACAIGWSPAAARAEATSGKHERTNPRVLVSRWRLMSTAKTASPTAREAAARKLARRPQ